MPNFWLPLNASVMTNLEDSFIICSLRQFVEGVNFFDVSGEIKKNLLKDYLALTPCEIWRTDFNILLLNLLNY